jgi:hypothetical protein
LSHISSPFCAGYFGDGVSQTIFLGWIPISAFQVARITGVSHRDLASLPFFIRLQIHPLFYWQGLYPTASPAWNATSPRFA